MIGGGFSLARFWKVILRMSRPIRFLGAGLIYHVMARGNNKMALFLDEIDHHRLFDILTKVLHDFEVDCWSNCAMPNHYHLVLRTRQPNLSSAMRQLNGTFAQWWNRRHHHVGHVFQGRFKAQVVENDFYLLRLCRYVMLNPVRAGLCAAPEQWRWSSYRALAGLADPVCVDVDSLLSSFAGDLDIVEGRRRLVEYVKDRSDDEMGDWIRGDRRVIGSAAFAEQFKALASAASKEVPRKERRTGTPTIASLLSSSLRASRGLNEGIVRAHVDYAYSVEDISNCTGLTPRVITRLLRQQVPHAQPTTID